MTKILNNNIGDDMKKAKLELMVGDLMSVNAREMTDLLSDNKYNLDTILKPVDPELYYLLKEKYMVKQR